MKRPLFRGTVRFLTTLNGLKFRFCVSETRNKRRNRFCLFLLKNGQLPCVSVYEDLGSRVKHRSSLAMESSFLCFIRSASVAEDRVNEVNRMSISTERRITK